MFNKKYSYKTSGFTLAETLITLVIIGVIAAITVPNMIQKHRKTVAETRLKATYSVLSNMFKAAEVDHGSFASWDFSPYIKINSNSDNVMDQHDSFIKKYMLPYLRYKSYEKKTLKDFGYKNGILNPDGTKRFENTEMSNGLTLGNGTFIIANPFIQKLSNNNYVLFDINIWADINGPGNGPNVIGRDIFLFERLPITNYPLSLFGEYNNMFCWYTPPFDIDSYIQQNKCSVVINTTTGIMTFHPEYKQTREQIMANCKNGASKKASECGALILRDGWHISDDYPWSV